MSVLEVFMSISLHKFYDAMTRANKGTLPLDDDQRKALEHNFHTPLWIIAGPGTGKTHTLSWLVLKRILVDGIEPSKIVLTTFTNKAANELRTRLIQNQQKLVGLGALNEAKQIDVSQILLGTLHSLCSRILQDQRYEPTLRINVLEDELTQQFFVRRQGNLLLNCDDITFWQRFGFLKDSDRFSPNKAKKTEFACKLFNRITEFGANSEMMKASGDTHMDLLAKAYEEYLDKLKEKHRTDQAILQKHFLEFLQTSQGQSFIGSGFTVFVDEYQDTNPIQEEIYFTLVGTRGDFTVVGDDDQSLYRFRGATVESLIDFDERCKVYLKKDPTPVYLKENRRSHHAIVSWINGFIKNHPDMTDPLYRVRAPKKPDLIPKSSITGAYPAILSIVETSNPRAAIKMVEVIRQLIDGKFIHDYSQIAILTFSTKESTWGISAYTDALTAAGIPYYNPRNKKTQKQEHFQAMIGALSIILDPVFDDTNLPASLPRSVVEYIGNARSKYKELVPTNSELHEYVINSQQAIKSAKVDPTKKTNFLVRQGGRRVTLSGLWYKILSYEPFSTVLTQANIGEKLKALNMVLTDYESMYDYGELKIETDKSGFTIIDRWTLYNFYAVFVEGIHQDLNEPEDDEIVLEEHSINIMTIHQAKGLEFEVVFVVRPDNHPYESDTHIIEDELDPYITRPTKPASRRSRSKRAAEDVVRLFYVAYSRAKRLLCITAGTGPKDWNIVLPKPVDGTSVISKKHLKSLGVHVL